MHGGTDETNDISRVESPHHIGVNAFSFEMICKAYLKY